MRLARIRRLTARVFFSAALACSTPGCETSRPISDRSGAAAVENSRDGALDAPGTWETDAGTVFRFGDARGRVVVVAMFYSDCHGVCVVTKDDLRNIEASLSPRARERARFVLATLDPRRDTAARLRSYRAEERLSSRNWLLVRGDEKATQWLANLLGVEFGPDQSGRLVHASRLAIVDSSGRITRCVNGLAARLPELAAEVESLALARDAR